MDALRRRCSAFKRGKVFLMADFGAIEENWPRTNGRAVFKSRDHGRPSENLR